MKNLDGKVVVLGGLGVGKTSVVVRYVGKKFNNHITPTLGASFFSCKINVQNITVKLSIWDTAGQERFKAMAPMYYRGANAALLVFEITEYGSFEAMKRWARELQQNVETKMCLCVVGNKIDLAHNRQVKRDEALAYAKSIDALYCEVSALTNQGIDQVFLQLAFGIINLSGEQLEKTSLDVYEINEDYDDQLKRSSSNNDLRVTDIGQTEEVNNSINSIAIGDTFKPRMCC